jgi:hypothetical protein
MKAQHHNHSKSPKTQPTEKEIEREQFMSDNLTKQTPWHQYTNTTVCKSKLCETENNHIKQLYNKQ